MSYRVGSSPAQANRQAEAERGVNRSCEKPGKTFTVATINRKALQTYHFTLFLGVESTAYLVLAPCMNRKGQETGILSFVKRQNGEYIKY